MRASDLNPGPRRLLRRARRVDPNPTKLDPRDEADAEVLVEHGLVDRAPIYGGRFQGVRILDAGREALC